MRLASQIPKRKASNSGAEVGMVYLDWFGFCGAELGLVWCTVCGLVCFFRSKN